MKTLLTLLALSLLAFGCGDDDRSGTDTGGMITLEDTGTGVDTGTADPCLGVTCDPGETCVDGTCTGGTVCDPTPRPDLREIAMDPAAEGLLPRCAAATSTCIDGCMNGACLTSCLSADTTAPFDVGMGTTIDCDACFNIQFNACLDDSCNAEFDTFLCCADDAGCADINNCPACAAESDALTSCSMSRGVGLASCGAFLGACFPG